MKLTKERQERIEFYSKLVGIYGGIAAAIFALFQLGQSITQNSKELRWRQAGLAREMVNKMLDDEGWEAMLMLDWEDSGREFETKPDHREIIKGADVYKALDLNNNDFTDKDIFIRDRFERVFFLISQLQSAVRSDLVEFDDVRFPLSWYAANKMCQRKQLFENYMKEFSHPDSLRFFQNLDEWNNCKSQ